MESLGPEAWSGSTREKVSHCCLLEVGYVLLTCTLIAISVRVRDLLAGCIVVLMYVARELCDEVGWQQFLVLAQRKLVQGPSAAGLPSPLSKNVPSLPD
jgi:hypothetical protein